MSAPGAADRGQGLEHGGALVEVAGGGGGLDHRVLAADVVGGDRQVRGVLHAAHDVEVGQRGLDHDHVGALLHVEQRLAQRLVAVGGVHLVAAAVAEGRRRVGRLAERAVEGRGELGAVGEDRRVAEAVLVERGADGADAPVHHVARRDHVGARGGLRQRGPRQQLDARVVVDRAVGAQQAAVAVARVLAQAQVGDDEHVGVGVLDRARGELDGALVVPGARALLVLVRRGCRRAGRRGCRARGPRPPRRRRPRSRAGRRRAWRRSPRGRRGPPRRRAAGRSRRGPAASRARGRAAPAWRAGGAGAFAGRARLHRRRKPIRPRQPAWRPMASQSSTVRA